MSSLCACAAAASLLSMVTAAQPASARSAFTRRTTSAVGEALLAGGSERPLGDAGGSFVVGAGLSSLDGVSWVVVASAGCSLGGTCATEDVEVDGVGRGGSVASPVVAPPVVVSVVGSVLDVSEDAGLVLDGWAVRLRESPPFSSGSATADALPDGRNHNR
ncbi:hypothetical protein ABZ863_21060 [Saccharomonospora sp. NPDC046836]|uniref:hypothetical protein n=1 Tax=Saccharomonospora sp. NPDC046836 TaxID=3156921 RepID=UPI0033EDA533